MDETDARIRGLIGPTPRGVPTGRPDLPGVRSRARSRRVRRIAGGTIAALVVAAGIGVPVVALGPLHRRLPPAVSGPCPSRWTLQPAPVTGTRDETLNAIAAVSGTDAWAVGIAGNALGSHGPGLFHLDAVRVLHWDGEDWSETSVPQPSWTYRDPVFGRGGMVRTAGGSPDAVAASGHDDAWIVGHGAGPFAMHWDGDRWSIVPTPNVPGQDPSRGRVARLSGVTAIGPADAWAVGYRWTSGGTQPLTEHWDGHVWRIVPPAPTPNASFATVSASGPNDVWAAGRWYPEGSAETVYPLVEHWDGRRWSVVDTPIGSTPGLQLVTGIAARSPSDAWAVGSFPGQGGRTAPFAMHWNGRFWYLTQLPVVRPAEASVTLSAVGFGPERTVWAVGTAFRSGSSRGGLGVPPESTVVLRHDGDGWETIDASPFASSTLPPIARTASLSAVATARTGQVWAVGRERIPSRRRALIELGCGRAQPLG